MAKEKTNNDLVVFARGCLGRPYIYGTFGQILTEKILEQKARDYPTRLGPERVKYAKEHYLGKRTSDCEGLIKNFLWAEDPNSPPTYNAAQDLSANGAFEKATVKGVIGTMPERPGICVRYNGHVGVYVGNGEVIEARGFNYGTVKTKLKDRNWTHWFEHPFIKYEKEPEPMKKYCKPVIEVLEKGAHGDAVKILQFCLNLKGYSLETDGSFGSKTDEAVRDFQQKNKISNPGVVGVKTWTLLFR